MAEQPQISPPQIAQRTDSGAIAALVTGVLAPFGATFFGLPGVILGVVAVFLGLGARRRIKRSNGALAGGGMALAGWIVGAIGAAGGLLWGLYLLALYSAMVSTGGGKGGP